MNVHASEGIKRAIKNEYEEDSGGDAFRGNTRTHPEHEGKDLDGRWYYTGDGMGK